MAPADRGWSPDRVPIFWEGSQSKEGAVSPFMGEA